MTDASVTESQQATRHCNFCNESEFRVRRLVSSPEFNGVTNYICDKCVETSAVTLRDTDVVDVIYLTKIHGLHIYGRGELWAKLGLNGAELFEKALGPDATGRDLSQMTARDLVADLVWTAACGVADKLAAKELDERIAEARERVAKYESLAGAPVELHRLLALKRAHEPV